MKLARLLLVFAAVLAALPVLAEKKVLGKLGQALKTMPIFSKMDAKSKVLYRSKAFEYIVVKPAKYKAWTAVLLQNGRYGYVQTERVAILPYEVTTDQSRTQTRSTSHPSSRGSFPSNGATPPLGTSLAAVAKISTNYIGVKYVWGGNDLNTGVDCSSFMQKIFIQIGKKLPRTAREQIFVGQPINRLEDLQPGDRLYFWSSKRNMVGHTGVYLGNGYFCHASFGKGQVRTDYLSKNWLSILVAARR
ncbi:MAG: C40 family peptidase [Fimbriimonadaceae bacterium]